MITEIFSDEVRSIIAAIYRTATLAELKTLLSTEFRALLRHDMTAFGVIETDTLRVKNVVNIDFPRGYLTRVIDGTGILTSPVAKTWSRSRAPQFFDLNDMRAQTSGQFVDAICDFDVRNIASHGVTDLASNVGSYFAFGRMHSPDPERVRNLLALLVPYIHMAFTKILSRDAMDACDLRTNVTKLPETTGDTPYRKGLSPLTARECEVLTWLGFGKTNSEIATILDISTFTIKNHVQNILLKLGANNRSHAVWRASEIGIDRYVRPNRRTY